MSKALVNQQCVLSRCAVPFHFGLCSLLIQYVALLNGTVRVMIPLIRLHKVLILSKLHIFTERGGRKGPPAGNKAEGWTRPRIGVRPAARVATYAPDRHRDAIHCICLDSTTIHVVCCVHM
jgi:hypothetical protein